jgi:hypothetical protein
VIHEQIERRKERDRHSTTQVERPSPGEPRGVRTRFNRGLERVRICVGHPAPNPYAQTAMMPVVLLPGPEVRGGAVGGPPPQCSTAFGAPPAAPLGLGPAVREGSAGHYALAVGVGVLLAVLIDGGFFAWRDRRAPTVDAAPRSLGAVVANGLRARLPAPADTAARSAPERRPRDVEERSHGGPLNLRLRP